MASVSGAEIHPSNAGIGGAGSVNVLDNNATEIPFTVHFEGGAGDAHVSAATLTKMCGNVVPTQINPVALSFGTTSNMNSSAHFISAHLGAPGNTIPLHTQGREFHLSSEKSVGGVEGTMNAAHAVANPGLYQKGYLRHDLFDMSDVHGSSHPSAGHTSTVNAAMTAKGIRQAMTWSNSVNATMGDVMHGCVTAKSPIDGEPARVYIPLTSEGEKTGCAQLAALCKRKEEELSPLMGEHYVTQSMANPIMKGIHVPHVVVTEQAAKAAAQGLVNNLCGGPLANGMTFSCRDAAGNCPSKQVCVDVKMIRVPGVVSGVDLSPGESLLQKHIEHLFDGETRSTPAAMPAPSAQSATDAITKEMFNKPIRFNGPNAAAEPAPLAPTEVVMHGATANETGGPTRADETESA